MPVDVNDAFLAHTHHAEGTTWAACARTLAKLADADCEKRRRDAAARGNVADDAVHGDAGLSGFILMPQRRRCSPLSSPAVLAAWGGSGRSAPAVNPMGQRVTDRFKLEMRPRS